MNFTGLSDAISTTETNTRKLLRNGTSASDWNVRATNYNTAAVGRRSLAPVR